ncbi:MAG TPA: hypothetical protein VM051_02180 [Usitatibacter sp.]|nr:hypothetical protein [Usitatibacter sp.]
MRALSAAAVLFAASLALHCAAASAARDAEAFLRLAPAIERIARLHAQSGQAVMAQRSRRALADATRDFDSTLRAAQGAASGAEARENYALLALLWHDYRDWLQRPPSRETARRLRDRTEELAWVASKGVRLVNDAAPGRVSASALRASQAAAASQRIGKAYLWRRWDIRDDGLDRELRESRESLPRALETIARTPGVPPDIITHVESAQTQWRFLSDASAQLDAAPTNARALEFACKAADHIFESMQRLMGEL